MRGSTFLGVLFGILAALTLLGLVSANRLLDRAEYGVVVIALALIAGRGFRIGITQTDGEVKLRALQRTYTYRRQEVSRFIVLSRPVRFRPGVSVSLLAIDLSDGETRIYWPFGRGGPVSGTGDEINTIAEQLNLAWRIGT